MRLQRSSIKSHAFFNKVIYILIAANMVMQKPLLNAEKRALLIDRTEPNLIKKTNIIDNFTVP